jgi:hypothetical protein
MTTGRQAFHGPTTALIHEAILSHALTSIASLKPDAPSKLDQIVSKRSKKTVTCAITALAIWAVT